MFTDIDNRASLIKFSLVTFSTNENSCSYTYVTGIHVKKKIISANDRDKLNPDPGCKWNFTIFALSNSRRPKSATCACRTYVDAGSLRVCVDLIKF